MTRKKNSYKIIGYAFLLLFYAHSSFSGEVYKTAILVNDAEKPDLVSSQIQKLLEEETGREIIFIGAKQLKEGTQSLQGLSSLICLIYGGNDKVSYFDEKVMEKIENFLENGGLVFTNEEVCGGKILNYFGIAEFGPKSGWYPALKDSAFITWHENDPLFEGVTVYSGSPHEHDVDYWDSGDFEFLLWRVDNSLSYTGRYGVTKWLKDPDKYLAKGFSTGWDVNDVRDAFPEWKIGNGRIVLSFGAFWTFDYKTGKGGVFGKAGKKILVNVANYEKIHSTPETMFLIKENFSNGLDNWKTFGSPSPQIVDEVHGYKYVFDNNGDGWCDSGIISKKTITDVKNLEIETDVYLDVWDYSGCWVEIGIGLSNGKLQSTGSCAGENYQWYSLAGFAMVGDACWAEDKKFRRHSYIYWPGGDRWDFVADDYVNGWHRLSVLIDSDYYVTIKLDGKTIGKSEQPIPEEYRKNVYLLIGRRSSNYGGKAYLDNLTVAQQKQQSESGTCLTSSDISSLPSGWTNLGTACEIGQDQFNDLFGDVKFVWKWNENEQKWEFWTKDEDILKFANYLGIRTIEVIPANRGFWVKKE
jgi:hypothetical protein